MYNYPGNLQFSINGLSTWNHGKILNGLVLFVLDLEKLLLVIWVITTHTYKTIIFWWHLKTGLRFIWICFAINLMSGQFFFVKQYWYIFQVSTDNTVIVYIMIIHIKQ